jgi:molybdopterin converting factor small subunit
MEKEVQIKLKMFMKFKEYLPDGGSNGKADLSLPEGATFEDLLNFLNMPVSDDKIIVINGISHKQGNRVSALQLKEGDVVAVFPPIAGG